jgi:hypothetical protein
MASPRSSSPWLLLVFNLPAKQASARVDIWRKLKRAGALPLRTSGYLLPNNPANQERLEWLAAGIRNCRGEASVAEVASFNGLPRDKIVQLFLEARNRDYQQIIDSLKRPRGHRSSQLARARRKLAEIAAIDFFGSPMRERLENLLQAAQRPDSTRPGKGRGRKQFIKRTWVTRPRPGIDRVSSAWLIQRFVDPQARFVFAADPGQFPEAIPFDMFSTEGFGHRGDDCTFETLAREFSIGEAKVRSMAQIIHDADLNDEKFGRTEGAGLDRVLNGWSRQRLSDNELLRRGIELIEGLYSAL